MHFYSISHFFRMLLLKLYKRAEDNGAPYIAFGIFGLLNYPLSHIMWREVIPQIYSPFSLRFIAALLCIPLILKNYWPIKLRYFIGFYWYATLLYSLPFFGTFMLLKNHFSADWLMNNLLGFFLFVCLVDWVSFIILLISGICIGTFFYWLTAGNLAYVLARSTVELYAYMYFFVIIIGAIFSRNKELTAKEKLQTIRSIGASIAHELRTPLRTIHSAASGIKKFFPDLLEGYQLAKKNKLPVKFISPANLETLLTACDDIESEAQAAFTVITMLLMNVTDSADKKEYKVTPIDKCIDETIRRYPFDIGEGQLVHWNHENNFFFFGNELLIIHIIFNLFKNALYQIKGARKGEIYIWTELGKKYNCLHFKDTASGVPDKILPHIFDRFFTKTYHGTGIGLAFCRVVMENLGGKISCESVEGEYAEFILHFPKDSELPPAS